MQQEILQSCYVPPVSVFANLDLVDEGLNSDQQLVRSLCEWAGMKPSAVARLAKLAATTITRPYNGEATTRISGPTIDKLKKAFPKFPGWGAPLPDLPPVPDVISYVAIDIMPTFGGMGGGGTGDADVERALVPRYLVEDVFRGKPSDFVVVRTRGDSMAPDFHHDDELLCDKRDTNPVQPGPFALWDAEDEAYVVKNVEKLPGGRYRVFSTNPKFTAHEVTREETRIIGRPVWFGRRL